MRKSFLISILCITSYNAQAEAISSMQGINDQYLRCYALNSAAKKECTDKLAVKYIPNELKHDREYVQGFQFEAEKQGFKQFLIIHGLPCESIDEGPIFIEEQKAYLVTCKPKGKYFMQFNYETKVWQLVREEENND